MSAKEDSRGDYWIWVTGSAVAFSLLLLIGVFALILYNGMGYFWPKAVVEFELASGEKIFAEQLDRASYVKDEGLTKVHRLKLKRGNRDLSGQDYIWLDENEIATHTKPDQVVVVERLEWGNFYGRPLRVLDNGAVVAQGYEQSLNLTQAKLTGDESLQNVSLVCADAQGTEKEIRLEDITEVYEPNRLSFTAKIGFYLHRIWGFLSGSPREANTEGGIWPALFGTVMMIFIMTIAVTPLGVIAAIYLREYASQGVIVSIVRIAVNNLAGVPSVVFGVFGVGFFIYFLGGSIDQLFFSDSLPTPTFGTGGILWSSLTLALLTVPTVIVATEEGLAAIPNHWRQASYALGATKFETVSRVVIPALLPAILTGVILAISRAAGEVAPLMITGVVKLAPTMPLDTVAPFMHFDRKFMHLGFHIYDLGFQSPNVDAAQPMLFATTLLLLLLVLGLNLVAVFARSRLQHRLAGSAL